ncbi:MAG: hypothetical protein QY318_00575 [Candidatus Dojkabacteria bacterium]|nr:MAG: hypothetical protein QY318_00575 [Candidatus Dojkabacteria bacterium]
MINSYGQMSTEELYGHVDEHFRDREAQYEGIHTILKTERPDSWGGFAIGPDTFGWTRYTLRPDNAEMMPQYENDSSLSAVRLYRVLNAQQDELYVIIYAMGSKVERVLCNPQMIDLTPFQIQTIMNEMLLEHIQNQRGSR